MDINDDEGTKETGSARVSQAETSVWPRANPGQTPSLYT